MKKLNLVLSALISFMFLTACGGDNAFDGETGLLTTSSSNDAFSSMQKNIFALHSNELNATLQTIATQLSGFDDNLTSTDVSTLQTNCLSTMNAWKSVQATFIVAEYDSSLSDTEQLLDFFNTGKTLDVAGDIDSALSSSNSVVDSLFKNSSKSITALEYLIFGRQSTNDDLVVLMNENSKRRVETLKVVITTMQTHVADIVNFYENDTEFISNTTDASNNLVNELVDSAFKLREQRIGNAAGFVIKFKDDPDPTRLEYYFSQKSLDAIKEILTTHNEVMGEQSYENFGSFAIANGSSTVVSDIRLNIRDALLIVDEFSSPIESSISTTAVDEKVERLYDKITELQTNYFSSLISSLNLTAQIIEADGD